MCQWVFFDSESLGIQGSPVILLSCYPVILLSCYPVILLSCYPRPYSSNLLRILKDSLTLKQMEDLVPDLTTLSSLYYSYHQVISLLNLTSHLEATNRHYDAFEV